MKKLVIHLVGVVVFGLCLAVVSTLNAHAQQGGTQNNHQNNQMMENVRPLSNSIKLCNKRSRRIANRKSNYISKLSS